MARKRNIWHPSYPVRITGASRWQESTSNPGAFYREIYVEKDGVVIGRQFVDESMENYHSGAWDLILGALVEGFEIRGTGCIVIGLSGDPYLDCDHFHAESVESSIDRRLFV